NSLLFSREFSLASGAELTEANYAERLLAEVKRSFLYFKQRYRGKEVGKGFLSGDIQDLRNPATLLAKELDIEVDVFGLPNGLEISLPGEKMSEFQSLLPSLTIPMGLAIAGLRQSRVNLLSWEGISRKGVWRTAIPLLSPFGKGGVRGIASVILLLMLFGSYLWLSITNFCTQRTKLTTLKALESLRPELENINKLQEGRHEHDARLLLIERLNAPRTHWSELFREISWLVPEDIVFDKLEARQETCSERGESKGQRQRMIIEGKADSKDKFNKFLSHLQNSSSMAVGARFIVPNESGFDKSNPYKFVIECEARQ
ncbi:MAG TPA: PilN domain-containing protein, partial [Candidatus Brocadiales bacterium]|nr:PilN domain-containing protein [Candidatus Brocadiales bacterium]